MNSFAARFDSSTGQIEVVGTLSEMEGQIPRETTIHALRRSNGLYGVLSLMLGTSAYGPDFHINGTQANALHEATRPDRTPARWAQKIFGPELATPQQLAKLIHVTRTRGMCVASLNRNFLAQANITILLDGEDVSGDPKRIACLMSAVGAQQHMPEPAVGGHQQVSESDTRRTFKIGDTELTLWRDETTKQMVVKVRNLSVAELEMNPEQLQDILAMFEVVSSSKIDLRSMKDGCVELTLELSAEGYEKLLRTIHDGEFAHLSITEAWEVFPTPECVSAESFDDDLADCTHLLDRFRVARAYFEAIWGEEASFIYEEELEATSLQFACGFLRAVLADERLRAKCQKIKKIWLYSTDGEQRWHVRNGELFVYAGDSKEFNSVDYDHIAAIILIGLFAGLFDRVHPMLRDKPITVCPQRIVVIGAEPYFGSSVGRLRHVREIIDRYEESHARAVRDSDAQSRDMVLIEPESPRDSGIITVFDWPVVSSDALRESHKPCVLLFHGPTGCGKSVARVQRIPEELQSSHYQVHSIGNDCAKSEFIKAWRNAFCARNKLLVGDFAFEILQKLLDRLSPWWEHETEHRSCSKQDVGDWAKSVDQTQRVRESLQASRSQLCWIGDGYNNSEIFEAWQSGPHSVDDEFLVRHIASVVRRDRLLDQTSLWRGHGLGCWEDLLSSWSRLYTDEGGRLVLNSSDILAWVAKPNDEVVGYVRQVRLQDESLVVLNLLERHQEQWKHVALEWNLLALEHQRVPDAQGFYREPGNDAAFLTLEAMDFFLKRKSLGELQIRPRSAWREWIVTEDDFRCFRPSTNSCDLEKGFRWAGEWPADRMKGDSRSQLRLLSWLRKDATHVGKLLTLQSCLEAILWEESRFDIQVERERVLVKGIEWESAGIESQWALPGLFGSTASPHYGSNRSHRVIVVVQHAFRGTIFRKLSERREYDAEVVERHIMAIPGMGWESGTVIRCVGSPWKPGLLVATNPEQSSGSWLMSLVVTGELHEARWTWLRDIVLETCRTTNMLWRLVRRK